MLLQAYGSEPGYAFAVVDKELHPRVSIESSKCMYTENYVNGDLLIKDVYIEEGVALDKNCIKLESMEPWRNKLLRRTRFKLKCPKSCSPGICEWTCRKCMDLVEIGIDDGFLYCNYGGGDAVCALFRCSDSKHGLIYSKYDKSRMQRFLHEAKMLKRTVILILGETGVGKTTWINALHNYLAYDTLQEACDSGDFDALIHSKFNYTDEEGQTKIIEVGHKTKDEISTTGHSATQQPKGCKFVLGSHEVTFVDTPGIGDVRGVEQDEKNFENILAHISNYKEIHSICILLKPNQSRLTSIFRFCISELLTHLHKSAAENIVFCFTNSRGTFFRPGDTLPTLKALLADYKDAHISVDPANTFCFDNEPFRFLACKKSGVSFTDEDVATFSSIWDLSVKETVRLFKYIQGKSPHDVENTISLNNARRNVLELSKPLALIKNEQSKGVMVQQSRSDEWTEAIKTKKEEEAEISNYKVGGTGL